MGKASLSGYWSWVSESHLMSVLPSKLMAGFRLAESVMRRLSPLLRSYTHNSKTESISYWLICALTTRR